MTIREALISLNTYPIPVNTIEKIGIDNELEVTDVYTTAVSISQAFALASADTWMWLHDSPSIVEQEVGINSAIAIKENLRDRANEIYNLYDSPKFSGKLVGNRGENWNG